MKTNSSLGGIRRRMIEVLECDPAGAKLLAVESGANADEPSERVLIDRPPTVPYFDTFGEGVPHEIAKFAAQTMQWPKLEAMLQAQVDKGELVEDWSKFAQPLYDGLRQVKKMKQDKE